MGTSAQSGYTCSGYFSPSDAIVLFDGKSLDQWMQADDKSPAKWTVSNNELKVNEQYGNIEPSDLLPIINCI